MEGDCGHDCNGGAGAACSHGATPYTQGLKELDVDRSIFAAAKRGDMARMRDLLARGKASVNSQDDYGFTCLHYASRNGHVEVAKFLLQSGANPNLFTRETRATPLHRACVCGHLAVVNLLLEHGARVEAVDDDGATCLHKAVEGGSAAVARVVWLRNPSLALGRDKKGRRPVDLLLDGAERCAASGESVPNKNNGNADSGSGSGGVVVAGGGEDMWRKVGEHWRELVEAWEKQQND